MLCCVLPCVRALSWPGDLEEDCRLEVIAARTDYSTVLLPVACTQHGALEAPEAYHLHVRECVSPFIRSRVSVCLCDCASLRCV